MAQQYYAGLIWTNHALARLKERGLSQELAARAFTEPDEFFPGKKTGTMEYRKKVESSVITLILKQNEKKEWLVLSAWIDPPLYGTKDYRKKQAYERYKKAGFWGKVWYTIKSQLGL